MLLSEVHTIRIDQLNTEATSSLHSVELHATRTIVKHTAACFGQPVVLTYNNEVTDNSDAHASFSACNIIPTDQTQRFGNGPGKCARKCITRLVYTLLACQYRAYSFHMPTTISSDIRRTMVL